MNPFVCLSEYYPPFLIFYIAVSVIDISWVEFCNALFSRPNSFWLQNPLDNNSRNSRFWIFRALLKDYYITAVKPCKLSNIRKGSYNHLQPKTLTRKDALKQKCIFFRSLYKKFNLKVFDKFLIYFLYQGTVVLGVSKRLLTWRSRVQILLDHVLCINMFKYKPVFTISCCFLSD